MKYIFKNKLNKALATVLDGVGYPAFWLARRKQKKFSDSPEIALVIRMDHIGDVLLSTGVPKVIKENFSGCRVIFLTASWAAPLLQGNPFVDEVILFDAPWFSKMRYKRSNKAYGLTKLISDLRKRKIDLALGLRGDLRENLVMFLAGIRERVGFGITGGGFLLTNEIVYRSDTHETQHQCDLLKSLGIKTGVAEPKIYLSDEENRAFEKRLERMGLPAGNKFICFLLGSGAPSKDWPSSRIDEFIQLFLRRFPLCKIVLVGSSLRSMDRLSPKSKENVINLVGDTSLRELCLLVKRAAFFVGPDSGPTHIAAVMGTPTVFLYSGTNRYERWKPTEESSIVLRHEVPCSPCESDTCKVDGHPCMAQILAEDVLNVLNNRLG